MIFVNSEDFEKLDKFMSANHIMATGNRWESITGASEKMPSYEHKQISLMLNFNLELTSPIENQYSGF